MNVMRQALDDYLRIRRALGFKLEREGYLLPQFIDFLEAHGSVCVTTALALRWAMASPSRSVQRTIARLRMIRGFAQYLAALDPRTEIPPRELLAVPKSPRTTPYIYPDEEICGLMRAAPAFKGLKSATYSTLIGLLAATGMRVGEAIALDVADMSRVGLLVIRSGKFGKQRELPLHSTTSQALRQYASLRDRILPQPHSPAFLLSLAGTRLHYKNVHLAFLRLLHLTGLAERRPRPRLHDLRHTFAVTTLIRWYREGADIEARLPALATYLGHVAPSSTYWYLTATPELLQLARHRAEVGLGARP